MEGRLREDVAYLCRIKLRENYFEAPTAARQADRQAGREGRGGNASWQAECRIRGVGSGHPGPYISSSRVIFRGTIGVGFGFTVGVAALVSCSGITAGGDVDDATNVRGREITMLKRYLTHKLGTALCGSQ